MTDHSYTAIPFNGPASAEYFTDDSTAMRNAMNSLTDRIKKRLPYCPVVMIGIFPDTKIIKEAGEIYGKYPGSLVSASDLKPFNKETRLYQLRTYRQCLDEMIAFVEALPDDV